MTTTKTAIIYRLYINKKGKKYFYVDWCRNEKSFKKILEKHNNYEKDYKTHLLYNYEDYNENDEVKIQCSSIIFKYTHLKELHEYLRKKRLFINGRSWSLGEVHIQEEIETDKILNNL